MNNSELIETEANLANKTYIPNKTIDLESDPFGGTFGKVLLIFCLCLSAAIIVENFLTIYVMTTTPSLRTVQNKYILSLACADGMVGVALIELYVVRALSWDCQVTVALLHSSVAVSMFNMMAIAIDRYIFIVEPFIHMRMITHSFTNSVIGLQWCVSLCYGFVPTFLFDLGKNKGCHPFFTLHHTMMTVAHVSHFVVNILVIGILYGLIARIAKQKSDQRKKQTQHLIQVLQNSTNDSRSSDNNRPRHVFRFFKREKKSKGVNKTNNTSGSHDHTSSCGSNCNSNNNESATRPCLRGKYDGPISMIGSTDEHQDTIDHTTCDNTDVKGITLPSRDSVPSKTLSTSGYESCSGKTTDSPDNHCDLQDIENNTISNASRKNLEVEETEKTSTCDSNRSQTTTLTKSVSGATHSSKGSIDSQTPTIPVIHIQSVKSSHSFRWIKQMVLVFGLFVLCWAPSLISTVLYLMGVMSQDPIYILSWFGVANSGFNFYVYSFVNPQFKKALKLKFKEKFKCCFRQIL